MTVNVEQIVDAIARVTSGAKRPVPLHEPYLGDREQERVRRCLESGWVSSAGPFVDEFEEKLAALCDAKAAVAVVNGTAGLHAALCLVGVAEGDEVIVPALTFIATANAVTYCGATPHFVDCDPRTLGLDPQKLRVHLETVAVCQGGKLINRVTGRTIRAVVPVHVFGHPVDMAALASVAAAFALSLVEDATEALGSSYRGAACGGLAQVGVLSFNGNKIVTTGGGGALIFQDETLAREAKHLTTTARIKHKWSFLHDQVGWNYRLPNINAALGLAQLERLLQLLAAKRALARRYAECFAGMKGVTVVKEPAGTESNYWLNAILLEDDSGAARDAVLRASHDAGFLARPAWTPMHELPMYRDCPRSDLSVTESLCRRIVNLPSSPSLMMNSASRAGLHA